MAELDIPNRSLFRQPEVCEIASIQPYVLRSWEAEFPDLGVAKTQGGPRIYQQELEQLELCDARKHARTPGVEAFLKTQ